MTRDRIINFTALALLTWAGFSYFPGHTWLQQDTQIYTAILEHLKDPTLLANDLVATRPHVSYTIYDETAIGIDRLTGMGLQFALQAQQVVFRFLGLLGVFWLASSMGLSRWASLFTAGVFGLGATIGGPAVLTLEYEPVPRGFAILLLFFALGLAGRRRWWLAGLAASLAFLYHPPTAIPFWIVAGGYVLKHPRGERTAGVVWATLLGIAALIGLRALQIGERESQSFLGQVDPALEQLQRMRASYNWIGLWPWYWIGQYAVLFGILLTAWRSLRVRMTPALRWLSLLLPIYGVLMIPASYVLLDVLKWNLLPQFQPARGVLFITAFAVILGTAAATQAAAKSRWIPAILYMIPVLALPANQRMLQLFSTDLSDPLIRTRLLLVIALSALAAVCGYWMTRKAPVAALACAIAVAAPVVLIPGLGQMRNYPTLRTEELVDLSAWARQNTPKSAVFLFADAGKDLAPGWFRANAMRSVYVDWKGGGQVNLLKEFADEWWSRWQGMGMANYTAKPWDEYSRAGIHYVVLRPANARQDGREVWRNARYVAYAVAP